ncbi:MAG: cytochrome c [Pseudolabrys sp.]|nr:cytochrome c [Pseudolabrys sp.]MBV9956682.1 cytochrome c [Pseudolabrys sp.]
MTRYVCAAALAVAFIFAGPTTGWSQAPAQLVEQRQEIMKSLWPAYYQEMARVVRGQSTDMPGVASRASQASEALKKAGQAFAPGTGRDAVPKTRATPAVWTQRADFEAALMRLITETDAIGSAAKSGNLDAVKAQWLKVAEACGGCHGGPAKSGGKFRFEEP